METNVVIKIYDADNNLDFEIPISSEQNSPLSINKDLSDLTNLTKRSGVQSRKFKIPISKEVARNYDYFNQVQHNNNKDVDGDKEAAIIINDNIFESGKARITDFVKDDGQESVELLFFGNNFVWTELGKNLTLANINWSVNTLTFSPTVVKNSWVNNVDNLDEYVFPLENRGGRKATSSVHTEDFRPAMFLHSVFTRFFQNIGYTIESDFINSAAFKKLVLTFFGNNFKNTQADLDFYKFKINSLAEYTTFLDSGGDEGINFGSGSVWNDSISPAFDTNSLFDVNAGFTQTNTIISPKSGEFVCAKNGYYKFDLSFNITNTIISGILRPYCKKTPASGIISLITKHYFLGIEDNVDGLKNGSSTVYLEIGDKINFLFEKSGSFSMENVEIAANLTSVIAEHDTFNFSDVLDDKVKVLDIINDVSRMFNFMFDTDPILKRVRIEPRNDFYDTIDQAIDITHLIDTSKPMNNVLNSNSHSREMVFSYNQDNADNYVKHRNVEEANLLAQYSHSLPNKFKEGVSTIKTKNIAPTYFIRDIGSVSISEQSKAPYTSRYWNTFSLEEPEEILTNHKPRILNYVYEKQVTTGIGTNYNEFRFYDETVNRDVIPAVLSHRIVTPQGDTIINPPINLQWHKRGGLIGLFGTYWSKTVTEIVEGSTSEMTIRVDSKFWNDFKFNNIFYIDEPIEFKGYYIVEKIRNYQPENSKLCKVKLLHRVEFSDQVEGTTDFEETPVTGNLSTERLAGSEPLEATFTDSNGNEFSAPMDIKL